MGNLLSIICSRGRFPSFAAAAPFLASLVLLSRGIGVYAGSPSQSGAGVVGDGVGDKQRLSHEHEFVRGLSLAVSLDLRRSPRNMEGEVGWWWLRIRGGYRLG
jgi:hypothetical protein